MITWLPMSEARLESWPPVLVCFRCPLSGNLETTPAWYDDGRDSDGEQVAEPGWWHFDQEETGPCEPFCWADYPIPGLDDLKRLNNPQVSA